MTKKIKYLTCIVLAISTFSCYGKQEINPPKTQEKSEDTWTFTVEVGIEKQTADAVGGYEKARQVIETQFAKISDKFNTAGVFDKKFCFKVSSFFMFKGPSSNFCFSAHPCCDVRMIYNGFCAEDDAGGGWYSGDIKCIHHRWNMDNRGGPFGSAATDGIAHEFGHVRGAIDIYALKVNKDKNPVNQEAFDGVKSIMNACYGENEWDIHSIHMINASADSINPPDLRNLFPPEIGIRVVNADDSPMPDCTIRVFPVSWYSYTVQEKAVVEGTSGNDGRFSFQENPFGISSEDKYPWNIEYCNFLVEVSDDSKKAYAWMPINEVQNAFFDGENFLLTVRL